MKKRLIISGVLSLAVVLFAQEAINEHFLGWSLQQAEAIGKSTYHDGKVGSRALLWLGVDRRGLKTDRSQNYKLRATWFTPEVIRASARWAQLRSRLTDNQTLALVDEAESSGDTVFMIEIDPNEGSGVIPPDWEAFLQPSGTTDSNDAVRGTEKPELRKVRALQGVIQRNYDYDRMWVVFPLVREDGGPVIKTQNREIEVVVRIYNREGAVSWLVPESIRERANVLARKHP